MSLMLRKQCQELLDDYGLSKYHAEVRTEHFGRPKHLFIVGECGEPFIIVHGISFSKISPTRAEIDYAIELLGDFLAVHKPKIDEYLMKAGAFKRMKKVGSHNEDESIEIQSNFQSSVKNSVSYKDGPFIIYLNEDNLVHKIHTNGLLRKSVFSFHKLQNYVFDSEKYHEAIAFRKARLEYVKTNLEVDDLKSELSQCEI